MSSAMVKRSLITALVLLLVYHFLLPHLSRDYYWIAGQQRANYLRAQRYVHDAPPDANVIVGSSMANELSTEILGAKFTKLTFPAGGSFTGLEMIRATDKHPKELWIEINTVLRDADQNMLEDVLSPWRRKLRSTSPIFKEEGRPSNYAIGLLNAWTGRVGHRISKLANRGRSPAPIAGGAVDPSVLANVMKVNREHLGQKPSAEVLAKRADHLASLIDEFTRRGTKCILFEMPIDPTLQDLAEPSAVRQAMVDRFPADKYRWFQIDHNHAYQTSDGIHLLKFEADSLTNQMLGVSGIGR
jgi:hypothetical protein